MNLYIDGQRPNVWKMHGKMLEVVRDVLARTRLCHTYTRTRHHGAWSMLRSISIPNPINAPGGLARIRPMYTSTLQPLC